jgi:hypothetical protein
MLYQRSGVLSLTEICQLKFMSTLTYEKNSLYCFQAFQTVLAAMLHHKGTRQSYQISISYHIFTLYLKGHNETLRLLNRNFNLIQKRANVIC